MEEFMKAVRQRMAAERAVRYARYAEHHAPDGLFPDAAQEKFYAELSELHQHAAGTA